MMNKDSCFIAHSTDDGRKPQTLSDHLNHVSLLAGKFGESLGLKEATALIGLYHDIGKYSDEFQKYIRGERTAKVDHSTAGAQLFYREKKSLRLLSLIGAFCIAGHHAGIPDWGGKGDFSGINRTLQARLKKDIPDYSNYMKEMVNPQGISFIPGKDIQKDPVRIALLIRMIFSCLVDADFLDTENFMNHGTIMRGHFHEIPYLWELFQKELERKGFFNPQTPLNRKRTDIISRCIESADMGDRIYSLTVPTGGGKTLSSLAFALRHAAIKGKQRIIYVIPYTSIIEQTADVFREFLPRQDIIEAHSQAGYDDSDESMEKRRLAAENWDAPVIVTTNVQFFESLFSNRTSKCRKLHNIGNSVIVFDEAQMFPVNSMKPVMKALQGLSDDWNCTLLLCSATQPPLGQFLEEKPHEIMNHINEMYRFFRRVQYKNEGLLEYADIADAMSAKDQILCVCTTKGEAEKIFDSLRGRINKSEGLYYLSTQLCPIHRKHVISRIKADLKAGRKCRVVSTSVISVGVDIDFPAVYLEMTGLDSIIQGAGRCNRNGKHTWKESVAHVFTTEKNQKSHFMQQEKQAAEIAEKIHPDISSPQAISTYFHELYNAKEAILDKKDIIGLSSNLAFETIGKEMKLIEDFTKSVFIPWNEEAKHLELELRQGIRTRELMRKASLYMINVQSSVKSQVPGLYEQLRDDGFIEPLDEEMAILTEPAWNQGIYDKIKGLTYIHKEGMGVML